MPASEGIAFTVETENGAARAIVARAALRKPSGRSPVTGQEPLGIHRHEPEGVVRAKVRRAGLRDVIRIEPTDL